MPLEVALEPVMPRNLSRCEGDSKRRVLRHAFS